MAKEDATTLRKRGEKKETVMREAPDDIPDEAKQRLRMKKQLPTVSIIGPTPQHPLFHHKHAKFLLYFSSCLYYIHAF
jgi:hypothetical protein